MLPSVSEKKVFIAFHTVVAVVLIPVQALESQVEIAVQTVTATVFIPFRIPEKNVLMLFQVLTKKVFTLVHTVSQSVPNQDRNTSATPFSASSTVEKMDLIPFHTVENRLFTASHAPDQFR